MDGQLTFECVKTGITQDKNGFVLRVRIHPNDLPSEVLNASVGSRFGVAMVIIGDNEEPQLSEDQLKRKKALRIAGILCRNIKFQKWIWEKMGYPSSNLVLSEDDKTREAQAAGAMRLALGVKTRKEIEYDESIYSKFKKLVNEYNLTLKNNDDVLPGQLKFVEEAFWDLN